MTATKLPTRANLKRGTIIDVQVVGGSRVDVTETVARAPSYYRALAVAGGNTYEEKTTIARATVSAKGSAVTGRLRIEAAVDTAYPVVQKFTGTDGVESKRVSTNESTWGAWRKIFDEIDKPNIATDVTGAGTAAAYSVGTSGATVPTLDGFGQTWTNEQIFSGGIRSNSIRFTATTNVTIDASGVLTPTNGFVTVSSNTGTSDDLTAVHMSGGFCMLVAAAGHTITLKQSADLEMGGSDYVMSGNKRVLLYTSSSFSVKLGAS